jgi:hypothetical protein
MQAEQKNSSTKIQNEVKLMKHVFTTNWQIRGVCPRETSEAKSRHNALQVCALEETLAHGRRFEECLSEAVEEELSTLGETIKRIVYFHLKTTFKIAKEEIPHRIEDFADAIERILGEGAKILEIQIMKRLYKKLDKDVICVSDKDVLIFTEYIEAAARLAEYSP